MLSSDLSQFGSARYDITMYLLSRANTGVAFDVSWRIANRLSELELKLELKWVDACGSRPELKVDRIELT